MKTKSKVLLSSIASIALCSSIAVGGTILRYVVKGTDANLQAGEELVTL